MYTRVLFGYSWEIHRIVNNSVRIPYLEYALDNSGTSGLCTISPGTQKIPLVTDYFPEEKQSNLKSNKTLNCIINSSHHLTTPNTKTITQYRFFQEHFMPVKWVKCFIFQTRCVPEKKEKTAIFVGHLFNVPWLGRNLLSSFNAKGQMEWLPTGYWLILYQFNFS